MSSPSDSSSTSPGAVALPASFLAELRLLPAVPDAPSPDGTSEAAPEAHLGDCAAAFVKQVARVGKQQMKTAQEITLLSAEVQGLADEMRRAVAGKEEIIDLLRRERDGLAQKNDALLGELLGVTDLFEHALRFARHSGDRRWIDELERVDKAMLRVLERLGLREIPALGMPFDPTLHEVVETLPLSRCKEAHLRVHDIVEVAQRGFQAIGPAQNIVRRALVITAAE